MPDAKAAARLVNSADQLVPGIQMEAKQLQKEAEKFEANLRRALEEQEKSTGGGPEDQSSMMYG
jgi:predicted ATP-grasp superfamily ATP-dependent carboligase